MKFQYKKRKNVGILYYYFLANFLKNSKKIKILLSEIFIHLLQPYPFVKYEWQMKILGSEVTYTINLVLYFLSMFRVYIIVKVVRYWNLYSKVRSKKILKFFDRYSNSDVFSYKANLSQRGFITLTLLAGFTLILFSLLLKAVEYYVNNPQSKFYYYWNSLWLLVVTMCTSKKNSIIFFSWLWGHSSLHCIR